MSSLDVRFWWLKTVHALEGLNVKTLSHIDGVVAASAQVSHDSLVHVNHMEVCTSRPVIPARLWRDHNAACVNLVYGDRTACK